MYRGLCEFVRDLLQVPIRKGTGSIDRGPCSGSEIA